VKGASYKNKLIESLKLMKLNEKMGISEKCLKLMEEMNK
jgi:hypothetical protein